MRVVLLNWCNYLGMGEQYVSRMRSMLREHLTVPHEVVVVTEAELPPGREGWFNKLSLLEMFEDDVLYLDLDVTINRNIDHLAHQLRLGRSRLWARNDFSYPVTPDARVKGNGYAGPLMQDGREATINSSVMLWNGPQLLDVTEAMISATHGDQGIITRCLWPDRIGLLPDDDIRSYRYHGGGGSITVYHGNPKPHEVEAWAA